MLPSACARVCECDSRGGRGPGRGRRARRSPAARGPAPAPAPRARRGRAARRSPETTPQSRPGAVAMSVAGLKKQFHKASQVGRRGEVGAWGCGDPGPRSPAALGLWRPEGPLLGRGGVARAARSLRRRPPPAPAAPGPRSAPSAVTRRASVGQEQRWRAAGAGARERGARRPARCARRRPPTRAGRGTPGPPGAYLEVGSPRGRVLQPRGGSGDAGSGGRLRVDPAGARHDPGPGLPMAVPRLRAVLAAPAGPLLLESRGLARRRRQTRKQTVRRTSTRRARRTARWGRLGKLPGGGDASLGN